MAPARTPVPRAASAGHRTPSAGSYCESLKQHLPLELSTSMAALSTWAAQYSTHGPHVAIEHMRRVECGWAAGSFS